VHSRACAVTRLRADVDAPRRSANCEARVIHERKVPCRKKLSLSDPDVGFIAKGQLASHRVQATSGTQRRGLHHGPVASQGNAADSEQLVPMVDEVIRRTTVIPGVLSVDDGYASAANVSDGPQDSGDQQSTARAGPNNTRTALDGPALANWPLK
jgi:hypothetical protein